MKKLLLEDCTAILRITLRYFLPRLLKRCFYLYYPCWLWNPQTPSARCTGIFYPA